MSTKSAVKKSAVKKSAPSKQSVTRNQIAEAALQRTKLKLMVIENDMPMPVRGGDPIFEAKVTELLTAIKPGQSFVVERKRFHMTRKVLNAKFSEYKIRRHELAPDKKFSRIWRVS